MKHLAILISVMILKSCGSSQDVANATNLDPMKINTTISGIYNIVELDSDKVSKALTIEFDSKTNKVSGFAGCNRFFGTYSTENQSISFSPLGASRMLCDDESNAIEQKMFKNIEKINAFDLFEGTLKLKQDNTVLFVATEAEKPQSRQADTDINLTYRASTRGFFEMIWIEGKTFKYTTDRNLKDIHSFEMTEAQYTEIQELYNNIDISTLPSLEPPSITFQYDAAALATLEITEGDKTFKTKAFDHGNPNKTISKLLTKILYLKETASKP